MTYNGRRTLLCVSVLRPELDDVWDTAEVNLWGLKWEKGLICCFAGTWAALLKEMRNILESGVFVKLASVEDDVRRDVLVSDPLWEEEPWNVVSDPFFCKLDFNWVRV